MITKKIIAESMPLALKMVRQQLGENAIIVNTRAIKTGGLFGLFAKQKYEVTAYSLEDNDSYKDRNAPLDLKVNDRNTVLNKSHLYKSNNEEAKEVSVFHKKPQKLYNYYSQQTDAAEKHEEQHEEKHAEKHEEKHVEKFDELAVVTSQKLEQENDNQLLDELQSMKKMMVNFIMNDKQGSSIPPSLGKWIDRLKKQGVDEKSVEFIIKKLLKKHESLNNLDDLIIRDELFSIIEAIIKKRVPKSIAIHENTRLINVIGPTGVGKTTSIAKLATEQVLKQKRKVAMITTDVYRIAAVEQLKTYAGILNVPIEVVRSTEDLEKALNKLENYDLIYMDSTGRNYKEVKNVESINEYLNYPIESDNYLVLSLTTKYDDMQILLDEFKSSPVKKLILTKLDETSSYGSILNIAIKYPYQIAYIANGQSVPEDITTVDAALLTRDLLGVKD
ncbi:MAG: hypothetical protein K0R71_1114 [Bacillales bacterium]|jgi:flagellar biosynthesis protein FlhF|nr:hypothetical protein [Bacillales bacterium]